MWLETVCFSFIFLHQKKYQRLQYNEKMLRDKDERDREWWTENTNIEWNSQIWYAFINVINENYLAWKEVCLEAFKRQLCETKTTFLCKSVNEIDLKMFFQVFVYNLNKAMFFPKLFSLFLHPSFFSLFNNEELLLEWIAQIIMFRFLFLFSFQVSRTDQLNETNDLNRAEIVSYAALKFKNNQNQGSL